MEHGSEMSGGESKTGLVSQVGGDEASPQIIPNVVLSFVDMSKQFIHAMAEVFPDCPHVAKYKLMYDNLILAITDEELLLERGKDTIKDFHAEMQPYYSLVMNKDDRLLTFAGDVQFIDALKIQDKWTDDLDAETKAAIWEYVGKLCEFANL